MSDSDQHSGIDTEDKKPIQFSIAFLLWLTTVCALVLGTAIWTPCFFNPVLASAMATLLTIAYRKGRQALWCSLMFGAGTTAIAYGDWLVNAVRFRPDPFEHAGNVFEALLFAIIGLAGGLSLASLPSNHKNMMPPGKQTTRYRRFRKMNERA